MRYTITGRNIDVTPGLRAAIEEKIGKLDRYCDTQCPEGQAENRGDHSGQGKYHPGGRIQQ